MNYYLFGPPNHTFFQIDYPALQNMYVVWSDKGLCCLDLFHFSKPFKYNDKTISFLAKLTRHRGPLLNFCEPSRTQIEELEKLLQNYDFDPTYPLDLVGTSFQIDVWNEIRNQTSISKYTTYKEVGDALNSKAYRAVGTSCANNNILGFVPCHRVFSQTSNRLQYKWGSELRSHILNKEKELSEKGTG